MWKRLHVLRSPENDGGGGGAAPAPAPAAPAPAPAAPAPSPAAPAPSSAAPAPASSSAPAPAPSAAPAPAGNWPDNWREIMANGDEKALSRLQRYQSPVAVGSGLIAAQNRISSGELKPVLSKTASAEELKEWRSAHGIPESHEKYDLGKDVKIEEQDKAFFDVLFKSAHDSHQSNDQVKATVKTWYGVREKVMDHQVKEDQRMKTESEDALRSEWGGEYRRNLNLIHGLLDGGGSQGLKEKLLSGRLADGTPIGSSPEALKMLLGLALINNPTGVVVEGGTGATGEGIRQELEKLQKMPSAKKSEAQSSRERDLIDAAMKAGIMDATGGWKK